jgi:hypothetical protein
MERVHEEGKTLGVRTQGADVALTWEIMGFIYLFPMFLMCLLSSFGKT